MLKAILVEAQKEKKRHGQKAPILLREFINNNEQNIDRNMDNFKLSQ